MNLCGNAIRLPEGKDKDGYDHILNEVRPHNEIDKDCSLVLSSTKNMTALESNLSFCENRMNHTIFQRENAMYVLPRLSQWKKGHKKKCKDWLSDQEKGQKAEEERARKEEK